VTASRQINHFCCLCALDLGTRCIGMIELFDVMTVITAVE